MKLEAFRNIPFRMQDLSSVYPDCVNLAMKAKRLEQDGDIIRMKKGIYVVSRDVSRVELSPYLIANHIYGPSYVSMQTALRYYGLIPEAVYTVQSMTSGIARSYRNSLGTFIYTHVSLPYYSVGVNVVEDSGVAFMMASREKALCDLMVYTHKLNLRYQREIRDYLEYDMRFDMDELLDFDVEIVRACAKESRKKVMLNQLIKFIEHERNL
jgi:hypothetical protein